MIFGGIWLVRSASRAGWGSREQASQIKGDTCFSESRSKSVCRPMASSFRRGIEAPAQLPPSTRTVALVSRLVRQHQVAEKCNEGNQWQMSGEVQSDGNDFKSGDLEQKKRKRSI